MKTEHTPEPWKNVKGVHVVSGEKQIARCWVENRPVSVAHANARRIVACVNACAGIPTEVLERYKLGIIGVDYKLTKQQRDELLAAIKKFLYENNPEGFGCACEPDRLCGPCSEAKRQRPLYAAIASVKEK